MSGPTRPTLRGTHGMVSSTHWLASAAGMSALERGGNAFDAAATAGFVLQVVEPHLNGPGGDLPAVFATAGDPTPRVLCGQGPVARTADPDAFDGMTLIPGAGPLAAVVPGAVDAWLLLLRDHGVLPLEQIVGPAIGYARHGHPLLPSVAATLNAVRELFSDAWPTSAQFWLPGGLVPRPWSMHRNTVWADVLQRLLDTGRDAVSREAAIDAARLEWREGLVAQRITAFQRQPFRDSSGSAHPGLLTLEDLSGWQAGYETPVVSAFRDVQVAKTGPWGQGPVLLQTLALLDGFDDDALDLSGADGIHRSVEALKLALADREAWYGDSAPVPMEALLSPAYTAERRRLIAQTASHELRPGSPDGLIPRLPSLQAPPTDRPDASVGEPTVARDGTMRGDTCHVDVVDSRGNIISATPSGGWLQSSPHIPDLGFCLGSRAQMFWLQPGLPSSLMGGRRPRTTLSPTLVLRGGRPVLACGTPGGDQQDQWQLSFLLRHLIEGLDLQDAIDAPAFHTTSMPASFYPREMEPGGLVVEDRVGAEVIADLRARGHEVTVAGGWSLGRLCAVARNPSTGLLSAAANARGNQGYAVGR